MSPILHPCSTLLKSFHNRKWDRACQIHSDSFHFSKIWLCVAPGMTIHPSQSLYRHPTRSRMLRLSITALLPIKLLALRAAFSSCCSTRSQKQKQKNEESQSPSCKSHQPNLTPKRWFMMRAEWPADGLEAVNCSNCRYVNNDIQQHTNAHFRSNEKYPRTLCLIPSPLE